MTSVARPSAGPVVHAVPWGAIAGATAIGLLLLVALGDEGRTVDVLRWGALALAMGLAGVVDDPAAELRAALPVPDRRIRLRAVGLAAPALVLAWTVLARVGTSTLLLGEGADAAAACLALVRGPLALEGLALAAVLLGVAAGARRRSGTGGAVAAGATGILLYIGLLLLPDRLAISVGPLDAVWRATHLRWAALLVGGALLAIHLLGDRWRRPSLRRAAVGATLAAALLGTFAAPSGAPDPAATVDRLVAGQGLAGADVVTDAGPLRHGAEPGAAAVLDVMVVADGHVARAHLPVDGDVRAADLHRWARGLPVVADGGALALLVAAAPPPGLALRHPRRPATGAAVAEVVVTPADGRTVASVATPGPSTCGVSIAGAVDEAGR